MSDGLVAIARIVRPRGLRGECVADILTDFPERFDETVDVIAIMPDGSQCGFKIRGHGFQKGRVNLMFEGIENIDAAEALRGAEICVPDDEAVELEEGEFFDWELIGCEVAVAGGGDPIGIVREVMRTGGTEILVVTGGSKEFLIPFAETICIEVNIEAKRILIDPPEGLLDF